MPLSHFISPLLKDSFNVFWSEVFVLPELPEPASHLHHEVTLATVHKLPAIPNLRQADGNNVGRKDVKSLMWEHTRDVQCAGIMGAEGGMSDFIFKVSSTFQKFLPRKIDEGFRIKRREDDGCVLLNSRNKWFTPKIVEHSFSQ